MAAWFSENIVFKWEVCWARWKKVDPSVKIWLWNGFKVMVFSKLLFFFIILLFILYSILILILLFFKEDFDITQLNEGQAERMWMKQAQKWYRSCMCAAKSEALETYATEDVKDLIGKPKLSWMLNEETWKSFVTYWNSPKDIKVSNSNKRSRSTEGAGIHKLGRKGLKTRMRDRVSLDSV